MFNKQSIGAVALALVLSLGIVGMTAYAQAPTLPSCDPSYDSGVCIPPKPPDLDCIEISERNIQVVGNDPHDLDRDSDGIGCEAPIAIGAPVQPEPEPTEPTAEPTAEPTPIEPETGPTPEVPPVIPAENETQTPEEPEPEPLPPVTNETVPIEGNVTLPVENENETTEPEPLPPVVNETASSGNETAELTPLPPITNETTEPEPLPPITNETIPIEGNVTVTEPEPEPETPPTEGNETIPTEPGVSPTEPPILPPPEEPEKNATQAFDNVVNASAILDERLNEAGDDVNGTERGDLRAAIGESLAAMGETSHLIVDATNDQLFSIQEISASISEAIDVVTDEGE